MRSKRKRRLYLVVLLIGAAALAASLIGYALSRNMNYLFTPSQVIAGQTEQYQTFRLGGMVKAGSIKHASDSLRIDFTVVDASHAMQVEYIGIAPDLFRDNQSVIATGHMLGQHFVASELLAKHDETYMPRELKQAMAKVHGGSAGNAEAAMRNSVRGGMNNSNSVQHQAPRASNSRSTEN